MNKSDVLILAAAALAVYMLLKKAGAGGSSGSDEWVRTQGNTGYPDQAYTGIPAAGGGVWV